MSTLIASNLQASGGAGTAAILASVNGGPIAGARNKLINGAMEIDQRNNGAAITLTGATSSGWPADRWNSVNNGSTLSLTFQNIADGPAGLTRCIRALVNTPKTVAAADEVYIYQAIEGFNVSDLAFGTASAKTVTLSFWVKSSLTGTFSGHLRGKLSASYRSYIFTYSISAANTWQYKTITVPGDTATAIDVTNVQGLSVLFDLGSGSNFQTGTLNAWQSGNFYRSTSSVNFAANSGATFFLTGVQLEVGPAATPLECRSVGVELALCQRYFYGYNYTSNSAVYADVGSRALPNVSVLFPVTMRTSPTVVISNGSGINVTVGSVSAISTGFTQTATATAAGYSSYSWTLTSASAEL